MTATSAGTRGCNAQQPLRSPSPKKRATENGAKRSSRGIRLFLACSVRHWILQCP